MHQVSNPVRWDLCMETMADLGVTAILEIPAGTLTGLAKRALPGVETLAVKTPDDLDAAWAMIKPTGPFPTCHLAHACGTGKGHVPTNPGRGRRRRTSAVHDRRKRRPSVARHLCTHRTAGCQNGWSRTGIRSHPANPSCACTRSAITAKGVRVSAPIKAPEGAPFARILATGSYRPSRVVTNDEICQTIDSSDEWIRERSGIIERRWAGDDETVATMSAAAAEKALAAAGLASQDIDVIIVATCTHPYQTPTAASEIASMIGVPTAAALDISAACAGFTYGLSMAQDMIRGGSARHVLLIGAEKLSAFTDIYDRSTAFIFADGAGAVVVGPSSTPAISPVVWGGDGDQLQAINMTQNWVDFKANGFDTFPAISMNGQQVFRWAVSEMTRVCRESLETAGITVKDLDAFIPHQANNRITDALVRALELPDSVAVARDIITTGNTSAASIPLAMDRMLASGEIHQGGNALLVGFGAGLVFASEVVTLP